MESITSFGRDDQLKILLKSSILSVPFNMILGFLLCLYLIHQQAPINIVSIWFLSLTAVSIIRIIFSLKAINKEWYRYNPDKMKFIFLLLVLCTALIWACSYFLFLPITSGNMSEAITILFLGGMCVGSLTSLSVVLPMFYAFLLPMFIPIIVYNFSFMEMSRSIMATMFLLFVIGLISFAKVSSALWSSVFKLSMDKDKLINDLKLVNKELKINSITDALTGLYNRRYFDEVILKELNRAKRNKQPLSLVFIDIDNFKQINDIYGHPEGDMFLQYVAEFLSYSVQRANDQLFRLGGDEFAIIMANSDLENAKKFLYSIIEKFNNDPIFNKYQHEDIRPELRVTVSIGLVWVPSVFKKNADQIVIAADKALYQAKHGGKNQIISTALM